jgi:hypothetical protein
MKVLWQLLLSTMIIGNRIMGVFAYLQKTSKYTQLTHLVNFQYTRVFCRSISAKLIKVKDVIVGFRNHQHIVHAHQKNNTSWQQYIIRNWLSIEAFKKHRRLISFFNFIHAIMFSLMQLRCSGLSKFTDGYINFRYFVCSYPFACNQV